MLVGLKIIITVLVSYSALKYADTLMSEEMDIEMLFKDVHSTSRSISECTEFQGCAKSPPSQLSS